MICRKLFKDGLTSIFSVFRIPHGDKSSVQGFQSSVLKFCRLQSASFEVSSLFGFKGYKDWGLWTVDCGLRTVEWGMRNEEWGTRNEEWGPRRCEAVPSPQSSILNSQFSILNLRSSILNPESSLLNPPSANNALFVAGRLRTAVLLQKPWFTAVLSRMSRKTQLRVSRTTFWENLLMRTSRKLWHPDHR